MPLFKLICSITVLGGLNFSKCNDSLQAQLWNFLDAHPCTDQLKFPKSQASHL